MKSKFASRFADLTALFLSFLLALVIWVNAQQTADPPIRRALQVPVAIIGLPDNVKLTEPLDSDITIIVTIDGPSSILNELTADNFTATADLSQTPIGSDEQVPIQLRTDTEKITLDPPAPDSLTVHMEPLISREIPVSLDLRGSVPRGHTAGEPLLEPAAITVRGIESEVDQLDFARVTVFLDTEDTQTKIVAPQPIFYDRQGRVASTSGLEIGANQVQVTIPINESADFANKVISVNVSGEPAPGYRVLNATVDPTTVLVTGRPTQLALPFQVTTEPIDVNGLTESFQTRVSLVLPEGITLDEVQEIIATVEIEPFSSSKIFNRPIEILGADDTMTVTVKPETVRVVLFGPSPILEALTDQEVVVNIDVFNLEDGQHVITPTVTIPDRGMELRSILPAVVAVEISTTLTLTDEITTTLSLTDTASTLSLDMATAVTGQFTHTHPPIHHSPDPVDLPKRDTYIL
jgi:YbbR domain-containing protein